MFSVPITKKISTDFSFFSRISFTSVVIFRKLRRIQAAAPSVREASHARLSRVNRFPCFLYVTSTRPPNILCVFFLSFTRVVIEQRRAWGQLFSGKKRKKRNLRRPDPEFRHIWRSSKCCAHRTGWTAGLWTDTSPCAW